MNRSSWLSHGLLSALVLLVACGGSATDEGDDDETGHPPAAMVGLWIFQSATVNGTPTPLADALEWDPATTAARFNIQAMGGYQYEEVNSAGAQIWSEFGWIFVDQEGGTIEVNVQGDSDGTTSDQFDLGYTLGGGVLTFELVEGSTTSVFTLTM
jgi:hypothetical protein